MRVERGGPDPSRLSSRLVEVKKKAFPKRWQEEIFQEEKRVGKKKGRTRKGSPRAKKRKDDASLIQLGEGEDNRARRRCSPRENRKK